MLVKLKLNTELLYILFDNVLNSVYDVLIYAGYIHYTKDHKIVKYQNILEKKMGDWQKLSLREPMGKPKSEVPIRYRATRINLHQLSGLTLATDASGPFGDELNF